MNATLTRLQNAGCDVSGSMERFLDDEEFYESCFTEVLEDPAFEALGEALAQHDVKAGFDAAHSLKGIIANLGIQPLYKIVVEIVEPLRAGSGDGLDGLYKELLEKRDEMRKLL